MKVLELQVIVRFGEERLGPATMPQRRSRVAREKEIESPCFGSGKLSRSTNSETMMRRLSCISDEEQEHTQTVIYAQGSFRFYSTAGPRSSPATSYRAPLSVMLLRERSKRRRRQGTTTRLPPAALSTPSGPPPPRPWSPPPLRPPPPPLSVSSSFWCRSSASSPLRPPPSSLLPDFPTIRARENASAATSVSCVLDNPSAYQ